MFQVTERVKDRYDFTFGYVSEQDFKLCDRPDCEWGADESLFVSVSLAVPLGNDRLRLRIGPAWFSDISRISTSKFRAVAGLEYRYDRFMFSIIHFSNGGSGGEREVCNEMFCFTDQYNLGLDSLFRLGVVF